MLSCTRKCEALIKADLISASLTKTALFPPRASASIKRHKFEAYTIVYVGFPASFYPAITSPHHNLLPEPRCGYA